jgi:hypothetical protein
MNSQIAPQQVQIEKFRGANQCGAWVGALRGALLGQDWSAIERFVKLRDGLTLTSALGAVKSGKKNLQARKGSIKEVTGENFHMHLGVFFLCEHEMFSTKVLKRVWKRPLQAPQPRIQESLDTNCTGAGHSLLQDGMQSA